MPSRFLGEILPVGGTYGMGFVFNVQLTVFGFVLLRYYCTLARDDRHALSRNACDLAVVRYSTRVQYVLYCIIEGFCKLIQLVQPDVIACPNVELVHGVRMRSPCVLTQPGRFHALYLRAHICGSRPRGALELARVSYTRRKKEREDIVSTLMYLITVRYSIQYSTVVLQYDTSLPNP